MALGLNFIVWGGWHGMLLVIYRLWTRLPINESELLPAWLRSCGSWLLTYVSVNIGWAFFVMDLDTARMFSGVCL